MNCSSVPKEMRSQRSCLNGCFPFEKLSWTQEPHAEEPRSPQPPAAWPAVPSSALSPSSCKDSHNARGLSSRSSRTVGQAAHAPSTCRDDDDGDWPTRALPEGQALLGTGRDRGFPSSPVCTVHGDHACTLEDTEAREGKCPAQCHPGKQAALAASAQCPSPQLQLRCPGQAEDQARR